MNWILFSATVFLSIIIAWLADIYYSSRWRTNRKKAKNGWKLIKQTLDYYRPDGSSYWYTWRLVDGCDPKTGHLCDLFRIEVRCCDRPHGVFQVNLKKGSVQKL